MTAQPASGQLTDVLTLDDLLKLSELDLLTLGPALSKLTGREVEEVERKLWIINDTLGTNLELAPK